MKHKDTYVYSTWKSCKFNLKKTAYKLKMPQKDVRNALQKYLETRMINKKKYKGSEENANKLLEAVGDIEAGIDFNPEKEIAWFDSEKWLNELREKGEI